MQRKKYLIILVIFFVILCSFLPFGAESFAEVGNGIEIKVTGGYEDTGIIGCYNPFKITINNKDNDFTGELQIVVAVSPNGKYIYADKVNVAKDTSKMYTIDAPVLSIKDKVHIKLVSGKNSIKNLDYGFKKFVSSESALIGVLCDDNGGFDSIKGLLLVKNPDMQVQGLQSFNNLGNLVNDLQKDENNAIDVKAASGKPTELINLDSVNFPEDINSLKAFSYLLISNFDTSVLSEKQKLTLSNWVDEGGVLLLGTGPNWKKVYGNLPNSLKPFAIDNSINISEVRNLGAFVGENSSFPNLNIITGSEGNGKVLIQENGIPLAVNYEKGRGMITFMTFDPSINPLSNWSGIHKLFQNLTDISISTQKTGNFIPLMQMSSFKKFAQDVPETQTPPFQIVMLLIIIYIFIVSPCTYFLLKWGKKSNLNWILIPLTAIVFMAVIYMAGFKTRFDTAVLNSFSLINIENESKVLHSNSYIAAFNNHPGLMKIGYEENTELNPENNYYKEIFQKQNNQILYKFLKSPTSLEAYGVKTWEARYIAAAGNDTLNDLVLNSVRVENGRLKATIKNPTEFDFMEGFIAFGQKFAYIGNILKGQEKSFDIELQNSSIMKNYDSYKYLVYGNNPQYSAKIKKNLRKIDLLDSFYQGYLIYQKENLTFCSFNESRSGYNLKINDKTPKYFNTNIIYTSIKISNK